MKCEDHPVYEMNSLDAVLRVLMLTVYADRIQRPQEITEIWRQIPKLQIFIEGEFFPDVSGLNALIEKHDAEVREMMDSSGYAEIVDRSIRRIDSPILIPMVLAAMKSIAIADSEFHRSENEIICQAAETWGVNP